MWMVRWVVGRGRAHRATGGRCRRRDSWATDAHKWLNVPYDSGVVFCREPRDLQAAMTVSAAYLVQDAAREPYHYTPELSRRARVEIWAALRSTGSRGFGRTDRAQLPISQPFCRRVARRWLYHPQRCGLESSDGFVW